MATYETFAAVYDEIMDDSLYDKWTDFSLRNLPQDTKTILELACGTGIQAVRFAQKGYEVTGLDLSYEMLELAQADMIALEGVGDFDAVTCYSDSLCYMADQEAVLRVFEGVHSVLNQGGTFLFDVHSIYQMEEVFAGYSYHENYEDFAFVWDTYEGEHEHSIVHELTFFVKDEDSQEERFIRRDEVHEERTYPIETYVELLKEAGFTSVEVFADFEDQAPTETSQRWFFKAVKA
ncbi:class I SAM-dependent methyltransferase [Streptococcus suis]|uniref:class I SAM-dependent DNA methyltransferase n=1 Tax=Streptococcus suis TaxID=1307 RepID=UPI00287F610E|nr:class I SAM-dependent methyltransferase [Streptococcus suis]WNF72027.1 class I SAM-dependent methyltransferase [Streptococcus suis]